MEKETDFARHLTIFLSDYLMKERGVSHHTLRSYAYTFDLMLDYMLEVEKIPAERIELKHLTRDCTTGFLDWLQTERKCTDNTRNARLAAIHAFCKYLQYEDVKRIGCWQQIMTIKAKHKASGPISSLSIEAMKTLLADKGRRFDYEVIKAMIQSIGVYPIGSIVLMNDTSIVRVVGTHPEAPLRPLIRVLIDETGHLYPNNKGKLIDLKEYKNTFIVKAIDPLQYQQKK